MSVREAINKNPVVSVILIVAAVVACVGFAVSSTANSSSSGIPTKAFYSDDDGATYFADDINKVAPFDHQGKQAVKAYVYRFGNHGPFVGYLERTTPEGAQKIAALKPTEPGYADKLAEMVGRHAEVKKPGGKDWFKPTSAAGSKAMSIQAPANETQDLDPVFP